MWPMPSNLETVRQLAKAERGLAVVAVVRPDGSVHASVVNAGILDAEPGGPYVAFVTGGQARKLAHLRRNGRCRLAGGDGRHVDVVVGNERGRRGPRSQGEGAVGAGHPFDRSADLPPLRVDE